MNLLISIVSWNYLSAVEKQLAVLLPELKEDDLIVVVETGKNDQVFSISDSRVQVTFLESNPGFAAAHSLQSSRLKEFKMDGIVLLNPDLTIPTGWLNQLRKQISESENQFVISAPVFEWKNNQLFLEYGGFPLDPGTKKLLNNATYDEKEKKIALEKHDYFVEDAHGAFLYFPINVIEQNGWMDPDYFLYGEENEYLHRLITKNIKIQLATGLALIHENGGTFSLNSELKNIREYYRTRNRLYNYRHFQGIKSLLNINYLFLIKYFIGRYVIRKKQFLNNDLNYYNYLGHIHFFKGIRGKVFDPNNYAK